LIALSPNRIPALSHFLVSLRFTPPIPISLPLPPESTLSPPLAHPYPSSNTLK